MNRKLLSSFLHKVKWRALEPGVSPSIETDNDFGCQSLTVPENSQTQITVKHNFNDGFYGIVINSSEVLCVFF